MKFIQFTDGDALILLLDVSWEIAFPLTSFLLTRSFFLSPMLTTVICVAVLITKAS